MESKKEKLIKWLKSFECEIEFLREAGCGLIFKLDKPLIQSEKLLEELADKIIKNTGKH